MKKLLTLLAAFFMLQTAAMAEDANFFQKGDLEAGFSGSYNRISVDVNDDSEDIDFFYADLGLSYFIIDNLSVGINTVWFYLPEIHDIEAYALGFEGNVRYHFQVNKHFVPYIGAHAAYYYANADIGNNSESEDMTAYGLHGGFKVPINENVYFDTQLKWTDYDMPWDEIDLSSVQVLLGLKIKF